MGPGRETGSVRAALFVTCMVDLFDPDVGDATVEVLRSIGADVEVPEGQTCCGQPAWNSGFAGDAARVAATTMTALERSHADVVVVPAGSCATMIKVFWPEMFEVTGDHDRSQRARALGGRVHELSELLAAHADALPDARPGDRTAEGRTVAYHHSCHMLRELHIDEAPERLLDRAGVERVEWSADTRCCGFGGMFSFKLPETSTAMADDKLTSLADAGCTDVVGCDTSCLLHLRARGEHEGIPVRTRHLAQALAEALRRPSAAGSDQDGASGGGA
jgi:L-lactate dehydrogenase complex protein LldE